MHCRKDKHQSTNLFIPRKAMIDMHGCDFRSAQGSTMLGRLGYMREKQGLQMKKISSARCYKR
jgi:hypothetical protein